jgi:polyisoprenoid-binding protein YceI
MKKITLLFMALGIISANAFAGETEGKMKVDTKTSTLVWKGSKVTGKTHTGTIALKNGTIGVEKGRIVSANVTVDMGTIQCTDDMSDEMTGKLVGHLQSPDFFNVAEHPTAFFTLSKFEKLKDGSYTVTGKITIKGISQEISFPARASFTDGGVTLDAEVVFDRSKFDVRYGSGSFFDDLGDNMISDDIAITLHIEAKV